jgi:hypothetical protein
MCPRPLVQYSNSIQVNRSDLEINRSSLGNCPADLQNPAISEHLHEELQYKAENSILTQITQWGQGTTPAGTYPC